MAGRPPSSWRWRCRWWWCCCSGCCRWRSSAATSWPSSWPRGRRRGQPPSPPILGGRRLAADRVTDAADPAVAVSVGGDTVTVTVTHPSATDVAMIGRLIDDVELRATVDDGARAADEVGPTAVGSSPVDLRARHDVVGTLPVVALSGSVDLATVPQLQRRRSPAGRRPSRRAGGRRSRRRRRPRRHGLGVLLGAAGRARQAGGELVVVCADERLAALRRTGFDRAVDVVGRLAELLGVLIGTSAARPADHVVGLRKDRRTGRRTSPRSS